MRRTHHCAILIAAATAVAACSDAPTAPSVRVVAARTEAALDLAIALPTLPRMAERVLERPTALPAASVSALSAARETWRAAEAAESAAEARELRASAYARAAPILAAALDVPSLRESRAAIAKWMRMAGGATAEVDLPGIESALADAGSLLARADEAMVANRRADAIAALLAAADRLESTTPRGVALRMVRSAERRWEAAASAADADRRPDGVTRRRAERLVFGARTALESGDYVRAIRRAYYAVRLLGGR